MNVSMQRDPTQNKPAPMYNSMGTQLNPMPTAPGATMPVGAPPGQYNPTTQFSMAGGPNPSPYATAPPGSAPYNAPAQPPYAPPYSTMPSQQMPPQMLQQPMQQPMPPQQYGTQQPYANPPLQQPMQQPMPMGGAPYGGQQYGAPGGGYVGSVPLAKGGNISLTKANPHLTKIQIGLGWDVRQTGGPAFDLDASAFLLKADGRVRMPQDMIFYNNKQAVDGSVWHHGDNLTGVGEGDDEVMSIDLTRVPPEVQKVVFVVSIYDAEARRQNFGMVSRAFIRVVDSLTQQEMCRFDLTEEASLLSSMIFGEVYRYGNEWKFRAVGQGIQGGLKSIGAMFGLNLM